LIESDLPEPNLFDQLKQTALLGAGWILTCPAVSAAGGADRMADKGPSQCLSVGSASDRSEFDGPRQPGAPEGTRPQAGRRCSRSAFGYFCRNKSNSHQLAQPAAKRFLTLKLKLKST